MPEKQSIITPDVSLACFPKMNILLQILLTVVTLGLYEPIWYLRRLKLIKTLDSRKQFSVALPIIALFFNSLQIIVGIVLASIIGGAIFPVLSNTFWILNLGICIALAFQLGRMLIDDSMLKKLPNVVFAVLLTTVFRFFYLQYKINRLVSDSKTNAEKQRKETRAMNNSSSILQQQPDIEKPKEQRANIKKVWGNYCLGAAIIILITSGSRLIKTFGISIERIRFGFDSGNTALMLNETNEMVIDVAGTLFSFVLFGTIAFGIWYALSGRKQKK